MKVTKSKSLIFRLTPDELTIIKLAAKMEGLTVTAYIKSNLEQQAREFPDLIAAYLAELEAA